MEDKYVPIEDVAEHFNVSVSTVRSWVRRGMLPTGSYIKAGKTYRYKIGRITEALENATVENQSSPEPWDEDIE
tara:strand:+ start:171 stop:392 length:222 start_codon:yes stop_codon:yes gene_type:complete